MTFLGMTLEEWLAYGIEPHVTWSLHGDVRGPGNANASVSTGTHPGVQKLLDALDEFAPHSHRAVEICRRLAFDHDSDFARTAVGYLWQAADGTEPMREPASRALEGILQTETWAAVRHVLQGAQWSEGKLVSGQRSPDAPPMAQSLQDACCRAWQRLLADPRIPRDLANQDANNLCDQNDDDASPVALALEVDGRVGWLARHTVAPDEVDSKWRRADEIAEHDGALSLRLKEAVRTSWARWVAEPRSSAQLREGLRQVSVAPLAADGWIVLLGRMDLPVTMLTAEAGQLVGLALEPPAAVALRRAFATAWLRQVRATTTQPEYEQARMAAVADAMAAPDLFAGHELELVRAVVEPPLANLASWSGCATLLLSRTTAEDAAVATLLRAAVQQVQKLSPTEADREALIEALEAAVGPKAVFASSAAAAGGLADLLVAGFPQSPAAFRCRAFVAWRLGHRDACLADLAKARQLAMEQQNDFEIVSADTALELLAVDGCWTKEARTEPLRRR